MNLAATFSMLALVAGQPALMWGPASRSERIERRYNPNAPPGSAYNPMQAVQTHPDWKPNSRQIRRAKARIDAKHQARRDRDQAQRRLVDQTIAKRAAKRANEIKVETLTTAESP